MKYAAMFMGLVGCAGVYLAHMPQANAAGCGCDASYSTCMQSGNAAACGQARSMCRSMCKDNKGTKRKLSKSANIAKQGNLMGKGLNMGDAAKKKSKNADIKLMCNDENKTIEGKKYRSKNIAIVASGNCRLTLKKVKVSAKTGIYIEGNAMITLVDSSIKGKRAGLVVNGNATVYLLGKSSIKSKKAVVLDGGGSNAKIFIAKKSKLKGKVDKKRVVITKNYKGESTSTGKVDGIKIGNDDTTPAKTGGIVID